MIFDPVASRVVHFDHGGAIQVFSTLIGTKNITDAQILQQKNPNSRLLP
jgi:hypothetical protein